MLPVKLPASVSHPTPRQNSPPVNHVVTLLQPAEARHPPSGCGAIQIHDHVVLGNKQLQAADDVPAQGVGNEVPVWGHWGSGPRGAQMLPLCSGLLSALLLGLWGNRDLLCRPG